MMSSSEITSLRLLKKTTPTGVVSGLVGIALCITHDVPTTMGGAIGGARGAMAPPIIWLGAILYLAPPPIFCTGI